MFGQLCPRAWPGVAEPFPECGLVDGAVGAGVRDAAAVAAAGDALALPDVAASAIPTPPAATPAARAPPMTNRRRGRRPFPNGMPTSLPAGEPLFGSLTKDGVATF
jgi:hypothetical protein